MIEEDVAYSESDLKRIGERWLEKIRQAEKREEDWTKAAGKAQAAFLCNSKDVENALPDFNILHSNVETIVPAIFNSSPVPDIRPRHSTSREDPAAKAAADILERVISAMVDDNALDKEIEKATQDAFMAGRGLVRVRFDADVSEVMDPMTGMPTEQVQNERIMFEVVAWNDYRQGPAKRWRDVPWTAYRHEVSEEEKERLEDPELVEKQEDRAVEEDLDCTIWEIWCKESGKVYFIVEESGKVLAIKDDPLELPGFFPHGEPVQPITGTSDLTPVCPYDVYAKLAEELDRITKRINAIMKGLKVRGVIAGDASVIEALGQLGDNELVPVPNLENLGALGGLDRAVLWWPVEQGIAVLQQLYSQREIVKQSIYEITGISDIVRGASQSGETATAQQIKTEWGSLRIKKMQRMVERSARDIMVISAEIISRHFSFETLQKISGIPIDQNVAQLLQKPLDHYRIDVETDSTIRSDLTKSRGEMSEFLRGTAEFFATMQPVVQAAPQAAGPLAKMYAAFAGQFNLGKSAEDALDQFVQMAEEAADQPQPNPEAEAMQAELQMRQQEMQMKAQDMQGRQQLELQKLQLQAENLGADLKLKQADLMLKEQQLNLDEAKAEVSAAMAMNEIEIEKDQERPVRIGK